MMMISCQKIPIVQRGLDITLIICNISHKMQESKKNEKLFVLNTLSYQYWIDYRLIENTR